jgi:hypothetical protein
MRDLNIGSPSPKDAFILSGNSQSIVCAADDFRNDGLASGEEDVNPRAPAAARIATAVPRRPQREPIRRLRSAREHEAMIVHRRYEPHRLRVRRGYHRCWRRELLD